MPSVLPVTIMARPVWRGIVDTVSVAEGKGRSYGQIRRRMAIGGRE